MKTYLIRFLTALLFALAAHRAPAAELAAQTQGTNLLMQVQGSSTDDWYLEASTNFTTWTTLTNFGTLLSADAELAPWRSVGNPGSAPSFYRTRKTGGLYDFTLFRTVNLVFTQANWSTLLAYSRTNQTNTECWMYLDNGATNHGVGARYKGNTSYTASGVKKSINLELDYTNANGDLMGYKTVNLNNAAGDETIMREAIYFQIMHQYTPCPMAAMCQVNVNGSLWGVYTLVEQENGQLIKEWFPDNEGDRWRAPNQAVGGFSSSNSAFHYFGNTEISNYTRHYELKSDNSPTNISWQRLINAIYVFNTTPTNQLRDVAENVIAVDSWLWFLAIENIFADDDSYFNKGADYGFYYEPESGRIHPVEHDGNEAFTAGDVSLSPVQGATGNNRPLLNRLLPVNELRQRYLAHMRTILNETFHPEILTPIISQFHTLSINAVLADPNKGFTMAAYTNDLTALKTFITNRYNFLISHAELAPFPPTIVAVNSSSTTPTPTQVPTITAQVLANNPNGIDSVWLYFRGQAYGRFTSVQMLDDGAHGDGAAGDGVYGAATTNYPAGSKVQYYIEARSGNATKTAIYAPARAEHITYDYRVALISAANSPVILNEFMADNTATIKDPQGEYEDWIELRNLSDQPVDLAGRYLTDDSTNPRKWQFPAGASIPANGYLVVWADEDGSDTPGLHASFKLSKGGEQIYFIDTDENHNAVLDFIVFGAQTTNKSYGRSAANEDVWKIQPPTPGAPNN